MNAIPTIAQLKQQIADDLRTKLGLSDNELKTVVDAMSSVLAAQFKLLYLFLSDVQNNVFPDTADLAADGGELERLGLIYLNRLPNPPTSGIYTVSVTAEAAAVLRSGLTFKSNDTSTSPGFLFVLDGEETMTGAGDTVQIRALTPGRESRLSVGNTLTITEPVIGVEQQVTVTVIDTAPLDGEDTADYRQAILNAIQLEPQGGSRTDYRLWAQDAQGVRKVYPYVKTSDAGVVQIFVEATIADSTDGRGTPTTAIKDDVAAVILLDPDTSKPIQERGRQPIQATIETVDIGLIPVDVTIGALVDDSSDVQDLIESTLNSFLYDVRPYIAGGELLRDKNDILYRGSIQSAVTEALAADNFFDSFQVDVNGVEVNTYIFDEGNIPYLRNLTFI